MPRHHHILSAASNLLGIALIIITGLHIGGAAEKRSPTRSPGWRRAA
jgi:hypothetical protein